MSPLSDEELKDLMVLAMQPLIQAVSNQVPYEALGRLCYRQVTGFALSSERKSNGDQHGSKTNT